MCRKKETNKGMRKVRVFVWFINCFARDTCVSKLPADIKGGEKKLRNGRGKGQR